MSRTDGLTVVVPTGFEPGRIPDVLERHAGWIERAHERAARERALMEPEPSDGFPRHVHLRALGEAWPVEYRATEVDRTAASERDGTRLVVSGAVGDPGPCRESLRRWLRRRGTRDLVPWLLRVADEHGFGVEDVHVRLQRSLWASCSARGTVSLNAKALFFPAPLLEHLLLHELCHTAHHDHSAAFWRLLTALDPQTAEHDAMLKTAWRYVPGWAER
jgi:predicted metal-dependent hydrolase